MFIIVVLSAILGLIGTDIFVPSLPAIAQSFQQTPNCTQLTISVFLAGFAFSQLFYGPISDRVGRRPPLIFGVVVFVFGSLLCIQASTFFYLCLGRVIQGIGVGAGLSLARVILRDCYQGTQLAIKTSQVGTFVSLTPALAPLIGGFLQQHFGFHASFIFMLGYGLLLLYLILFRFKETSHHINHTLSVSSVIVNYGQLLKSSYFICYAVIAGLAFAAIILYANIMPFIIQTELKLSPFANGMILLIAAFGVSMGSFISSRWVARIKPEKFIFYGLGLFTLCGFLLIITGLSGKPALIYLVPLIFLITTACGFIFPNALALCFSAVKCNIGIAGAIYGTLQTLISMLVNLLLNLLVHQGQALLGKFYLILGLSGLMIYTYQRFYANTVLTIVQESRIN